MLYRHIMDHEIRQMPVPDQFFKMAEAYLDAAVRQTSAVQSNPSSGWPDASVALFLAAHGTEMLLKAAVLKRNPSAEVKDLSHSIRKLVTAYRALYPEPEFAMEFPFCIDELPANMPKNIRNEIDSPSMVFRYTVDKENEQWQTLHGFIPGSFLQVLKELKQVMVRLRSIP